MNFADYKVNFGGIPIGQTVFKRFKFKNTSNNSSVFIITRRDNSGPNYPVFDFDHYEFQLNRNQEKSIKVTYQPTCPGQKDTDFFKIIGDDGDLYKLDVQGLCLGPEIQCSTKSVEFFKFLNYTQARKLIKFKNLSAKIPIIYQFNDDCDRIFLIEPKRGTIEPKQYKVITVKFSPNQPGCYSKRLTCLILNHPPIYIDLIGFYFKKIYIRDEFIYERYSSSIDKSLPVLTISQNYLDFGRGVVEDDSNRILTTEMTNHLEIPIEVRWEESNIFQINPNTIQIQPNVTVLFECKFEPDVNCKLFAQRIDGQIMWDTRSDNVAVPMTTNLTLMGHSFPENHEWFPKIEVQPQIVILPLTYPTFPSWATFTITSEEPVLFKLIPPEQTDFILKPMLGMIKKYQIILVELHTKLTYKSSFMETWNIEINGELLPTISIAIKAQTDLPEICFGIDNHVEFEATQPFCENTCCVPLINKSNIPLKFQFNDEDRKIVLDPHEGYLAKNEEIPIICTYRAELDDPNLYEIKYELQAVLNDGLLIGKHEDSIKCTINCEYSRLHSDPKLFNAGEIAFGSSLTIEFSIYNPDTSTVHFELFIMNTPYSIPHVFTPKCGSCEKQQQISIVLQLKANNFDKQTLQIGYRNRLNQQSNQIIELLVPVKLLTVKYCSILPIIQFERIIEHNLGPLFSKKYLWEIFKIDTLNERINRMKNSEVFSVELKAPYFEMRNKEYDIVFLLRNITSIPIFIKLKRKKLCDCNYVEVSKSLSFKQKVLLCPHREILRFDLSSNYIEANSTSCLTMKLNYTLPNPTRMCYIMNLDYDRIIVIYINIKPILPNYLLLSLYSIDNNIDFGEVYIGLKQPPIKIIWLYNNSNYQIIYNLKEAPLTQLNDFEEFEIIECLNSSGVISAYSLYPLLFRFCPIEMKLYEVTTILEYNSESLRINIEGSGICDIIMGEFQRKIVENSKYPPISTPVIQSIDDIVIEPILTWNTVEEFVTIQNITKDSCISYCWKPFIIDGILRIDFVKERGVLKPQESHKITVRINTLNEPCNTTVVLNCELLNVTEFDKYKEILDEINKEKLAKQDEFIITEQGIFYPNDDYTVTPPPEPTHITLTITVNTIGILDKDTCLPADYQMQHFNLSELLVKSHIKADSNLIDLLKRIDKDLLRSIINSLASDVLFSDYFREVVQLRNQSALFDYEIEEANEESLEQ